MPVLSGLLLCSFITGCESDPSSTGLYEYVRKGQAYIDEGKYDKAIFYLHKAYEGAPDSGDIRKNLLYGYIKYSDYLDRSGNIKKAIYYLEMAFEMDNTNKGVLSNLSYLYVKEAMKVLEAGDREGAYEYMQKASELAMMSDLARKNVANYLYNEAVEYYNSNDMGNALTLLNISYAMLPRDECLDFLGQVHYREDRLDKAIFYWTKYVQTHPENQEVMDKLEKAIKERELSGRLGKIELPFFEVEFEDVYDFNKDELKDILSDIYEKVGTDLDFYPPQDTKIIFYTPNSFMEIFQKTGIVRGFFDGNIRMPVDPRVSKSELAGILAHEYTHAILSMTTNGNCPIWIHEGLAVYEQARYAPINMAELASEVKGRKYFKIGAVEKGFVDYSEQLSIKVYYQAAFAAISFIIDKWGWPGLRSLLGRIKDKTHFANAIDEEFFVSMTGFEKMWNEYMSYKFSDSDADQHTATTV